MHVLGVIEALLIIVAASQIPESPKYLYAQKRFDEVRTIMKRIAGHNRCRITYDEIDRIIFDTEVEVLYPGLALHWKQEQNLEANQAKD